MAVMAGLAVAVPALPILLPNLPSADLLVLGNRRPELHSMPAVAEIAVSLLVPAVMLEGRAVVHTADIVHQIAAPVLFL